MIIYYYSRHGADAGPEVTLSWPPSTPHPGGPQHPVSLCAPIRCQRQTERCRCTHKSGARPLVKDFALVQEKAKETEELLLPRGGSTVVCERQTGPHPEETSQGPKSKEVIKS